MSDANNNGKTPQDLTIKGDVVITNGGMTIYPKDGGQPVSQPTPGSVRRLEVENLVITNRRGSPLPNQDFTAARPAYRDVQPSIAPPVSNPQPAASHRIAQQEMSSPPAAPTANSGRPFSYERRGMSVQIGNLVARNITVDGQPVSSSPRAETPSPAASVAKPPVNAETMEDEMKRLLREQKNSDVAHLVHTTPPQLRDGGQEQLDAFLRATDPETAQFTQNLLGLLQVGRNTGYRIHVYAEQAIKDADISDGSLAPEKSSAGIDQACMVWSSGEALRDYVDEIRADGRMPGVAFTRAFSWKMRK